MEPYLAIGILLSGALALCAALFCVSALFGPKNPTQVKMMPYECGIPAEGSAHTPFKSQFYLIAVLFLLFDVEAAFFFPWALVYKESLSMGGTLFWGILVYLGLLILGLAYIYRKNVLKLR